MDGKTEWSGAEVAHGLVCFAVLAAPCRLQGGVEKHLKGILRPVSQAIPPRSLVCLTKHLSSSTLLKGRLGRESKAVRNPKAGHPLSHRLAWSTGACSSVAVHHLA